MAEQEEVDTLELLNTSDSTSLQAAAVVVRRIIAERDAAVALALAHEAEAWKCRQEMTDMTAQNGVLLAEVKRLRNALDIITGLSRQSISLKMVEQMWDIAREALKGTSNAN